MVRLMMYEVCVTDQESDGKLYTLTDAQAVVKQRADEIVALLTTGGASLMADPDNWHVEAEPNGDLCINIWLNDAVYATVSVLPVEKDGDDMGNLGMELVRQQVIKEIEDTNVHDFTSWAIAEMLESLSFKDIESFYEHVTGSPLPQEVDNLDFELFMLLRNKLESVHAIMFQTI